MAEHPHPLLELTRARLVEFVRDPGTLFWVFGFPVVMAVALGIAFRNRGPEVAPVALFGPGAADIAARLGPPAGLDLHQVDEAEALQLLRTGQVDLAIRAGSPQGGDPPNVVFRYDPERPGAEAVRVLADRLIQRAWGQSDPVPTAVVQTALPGGRYIDFLTPGLIGLNIMGSCLWGMGYAVVDSRRRKLLKRFAATPMNRSHFLLAFVLSRLVFLVIEVLVLMLFAGLVFGVRVYGSWLSVGLVAIAGTAAFSGLALLVASRTESTEVASGWMNFVQLPMWLLSGSFFAYTRFPDFLHPFIRALPLTALNDAARAVVNHGAGIGEIWLELVSMLLWGLISFAAALKIFRWQ